ncbi:Na+/H+ antiporter subunit E [Streptomyces smyrnaeus]|uniref:Na+/H+ antiporter subunit E n=1 Tax=Streptomyces TaxID=1883 RepID=UPI000C19F6A5|nr:MULTISPECIES: Na+/H+ antiporter subunit E [unclassified Streptomyces]MBQ0864784.1 Na+/H+ antiporter subunit E [Streptomyces sp. RK75]MBQ1120551.1 Na+/H+ antiporter subunit E [Streptomyces sp. B15]MBQ1158743.1 Na+/H+ antiporter subunit E [Streptomyces sp. A73]
MTAPQRLPEASRLRATQWPMVLGLTLLWLLLWGTPTPANIVTGVLVALLVVLVFPLPPIEKQSHPHPLGILRFVARFALDMVVSSWRINRSILALGRPRCAVLAVRMRCPGDLLLTATAVAVTAVPGSTVLEVDRRSGTLYLHVLGGDREEDLARARRDALRLETRVVEAFGTAADVAAIRASETAQEVFGRWR